MHFALPLKLLLCGVVASEGEKKTGAGWLPPAAVGVGSILAWMGLVPKSASGLCKISFLVKGGKNLLGSLPWQAVSDPDRQILFFDTCFAI